MKSFELSIKKVCYGSATVEANNREDAIKIFKEGGEQYFEDFSENYPVDWIVEGVEEQYGENLSVEILQHKVEYWFRDEPELEVNECDIEHLEQMIKEGYSSGELCQYDCEKEEEYRGWWKIIK